MLPQLIIFSLLGLTSLLRLDSELTPVPPGPHLFFLAPHFSFGTIAPGAVVRHTFEFRNTGSLPLVISAIGSSCGCTTPSWTKTPVAPGRTGQISVTFNSVGKNGVQNRILTVESNSSTGPAVLSLLGEVGTPAQAATNPAGH